MAEDKAQTRRVVRAYLAERPSVSQSSETIHQMLKREHHLTHEQVRDACLFLMSLGHFESTRDPLGGSTLYFQATAAGIIAHEAES